MRGCRSCIDTYLSLLLAVGVLIGWGDAAGVAADERSKPKKTSTTSSAAYDPEERFDYQVREDLFAGFSGDNQALQRGLATCEEKLKESPNHPQALVWRGAARVFLSGKEFQNGNQLKGFQLWSEGLADMDKAVEVAPDDLAVLIPRAAVMLPAGRSAPAAMGLPLLKKVRADFERIYKSQQETFDQLGEHPRGELRMGLADVYRALGEAKKSEQQLKAVIEELPNTDYAARAAEWLNAKPDARLAHNCIGCHSE